MSHHLTDKCLQDLSNMYKWLSKLWGNADWKSLYLSSHSLTLQSSPELAMQWLSPFAKSRHLTLELWACCLETATFPSLRSQIYTSIRSRWPHQSSYWLALVLQRLGHGATLHKRPAPALWWHEKYSWMTSWCQVANLWRLTQSICLLLWKALCDTLKLQRTLRRLLIPKIWSLLRLGDECRTLCT